MTEPGWLQRLVAYHFGSGDAVFFGLLLLQIALCGVGWGWPRGRTVLLGVVAIVWIVLSGWPDRWGAELVVASFWLWLLRDTWLKDLPGPSPDAFRWGAMVLIVVTAVAELPYHRLFPLRSEVRSVAVVGDSLTAGLEASDRTWPKRLVETAGIRLHDASQQGATVASAKNQLEQLPHDADVLVLLIGGNDILERRSPEAFAVALDQLLTAAKAQCRTVVMQAIPLPPLANRYGALQRELARKHRVRLIPARRLMAVLTTRGATVDGIHLTDRGQELMARLMTTALGLTTIPPAEPAPSPAERSTNADSP